VHHLGVVRGPSELVRGGGRRRVGAVVLHRNPRSRVRGRSDAALSGGTSSSWST
jgi:hypothetical protein